MSPIALRELLAACDDPGTFGSFITRALGVLGVTKRALGHGVHVHGATVRRWEQGRLPHQSVQKATVEWVRGTARRKLSPRPRSTVLRPRVVAPTLFEYMFETQNTAPRIIHAVTDAGAVTKARRLAGGIPVSVVFTPDFRVVYRRAAA